MLTYRRISFRRCSFPGALSNEVGRKNHSSFAECNEVRTRQATAGNFTCSYRDSSLVQCTQHNYISNGWLDCTTKCQHTRNRLCTVATAEHRIQQTTHCAGGAYFTRGNTENQTGATFSKLSQDIFQRSSYVSWFRNSKKKFSFPNSQRLTLRFLRNSSFLISVNYSATNQMRLCRPRDVSTPV